ncbi:MAG: hypothetical protein RR584_14180, partial [Comamonas sp.]
MYSKTEPFIAPLPAFMALPKSLGGFMPEGGVPQVASTTAQQALLEPQLALLPRDHCILAFNERVMAWAR